MIGINGLLDGYYKVMSNSPKMGHLPTPVFESIWVNHHFHTDPWRCFRVPQNQVPWHLEVHLETAPASGIESTNGKPLVSICFALYPTKKKTQIFWLLDKKSLKIHISKTIPSDPCSILHATWDSGYFEDHSTLNRNWLTFPEPLGSPID